MSENINNPEQPAKRGRGRPKFSKNRVFHVELGVLCRMFAPSFKIIITKDLARLIKQTDGSVDVKEVDASELSKSIDKPIEKDEPISFQIVNPDEEKKG